LKEAFLVQMDDFDRLLESKLRGMLAAVVAKPPPARRWSRLRLVDESAGGHAATNAARRARAPF
jgi:hypothetical protein